MNIQDELFQLQDLGYKKFMQKLIPTVDPERIIGIRTPVFRAFSKKLKKEHPDVAAAFLEELPHRYFEENNLHSALISLEKDFERCMQQTEAFLPYVDNWATCDSFSPKIFNKHRAELYPKIKLWIQSDHCYTVRFGIGMLLEHFLGECFQEEHLRLVCALRSEEYYVNMMIAWYISMALVKQYDATLPYLQGEFMAIWTHNKAIQKAVESRQISDEKKAYLRRLKRKA